MFSSAKNKEFARSVLGDPSDLLDEAIAWIADNCEPDEVFKESDLNNWAYEQGFETPDDK